jgi:hypothetical protein
VNEDAPDRRDRDEELGALLGSLRSDLAQGEEASVARVDARLRAPARPVSPRWTLPAWVTVAAVGATAAVVVLMTRPAPVATPPQLDVGVEVVAGAGGIVSSLPGGEASFSLMPGASLRRGADGDGHVPTFVLERGIVTVDVTPGVLPGLVLDAGAVRVAVLGTSYVASVQGDLVSVSVLRGLVSVEHGDRVEQLGAGQGFSTADPPPEVVAVAQVPEEPPVIDPIPTDATPEEVREPITEPDLLALSPAESGFLDIQDMLAQGASAEDLLAATSGYLERHPAGQFSVEVEAFQVEATARTGRHREAFDLAGTFCAVHPDSPRRNQLLWLQATVARDRLHDCGLALGPYRELAALPGASGTDATYFHAVCALDQQLLDEAEAAFRQYLERAPAGAHAAHATEVLESLEGAAP